MTGRAVRFFRLADEYPEILDFNHAIQGTFHKWGTYNDNSVAIVEDMSGNVYRTAPELVRFDNPFNPKG